jgi:hypothetical protein
MDLFFLYFLSARKSRRRKHTSCFSKFGLSAASQTGESRGPEKRCEAARWHWFAFWAFPLYYFYHARSKRICGCSKDLCRFSLTSRVLEWERQALSPSRNHPGTLVWEPLAGDWDGGWECIFVHEWAFLAGAWDLGLGLGWAALP